MILEDIFSSDEILRHKVDLFLKDFYLFLEREEGREKESERNTDVREKH